LSITSFYQIVPDTAHGHLFISQGRRSSNEILVTNLAGQQVATIPGQDGVMGIAISPDGSTLYAALSASHAVSAIDTSTLLETASYSLGSTDTPKNLAVQSGKVWVSYGTPFVPPATPAAAQIGDINLSASPPAFESQAGMGGWINVPELAADPQDSGVLVAVEPDTSSVVAATYNVTTDPPTVLNQPDPVGIGGPVDPCDFVSDLAVAPGGSEFTTACQTPDNDYRFSTADLSEQGSYPGTHYPAAVAIDSNGDVAIGTTRNATVPDVYIYRQDGDTPLNTYTLGLSGGNLMDRGLAWAPDGSQLFVVMQTSPRGFRLHVLPYPTLKAPSLTVTTRRSTVAYNSSVSVTAHLGQTATNRTVQLYSQNLGSTHKTLLKTGTVDSHGNLAATFKAAHSTIISAVFSGDASDGPATASRMIGVRAKVSESLRGYYRSERIGSRTYRLFHRGNLLRAIGTVTPNKAGQCVVFEVQEFYRRAWHANVTSRCATLSRSSTAGGKFGLTQAGIGRHYRIRVDYRRSRTDDTNVNNDSAWQYLIVEH
jgi:YVTN family beta-propeller protein